MKLFKIASILLVLSLLAVSPLGCAAPSKSASVPPSQVATVERGNLKIEVTASGNLALSRKEDLAFEVTSMQVQRVLSVREVLVEVGDSVKEGQVLAKVDTSEWDDQLRTLERDLSTKKRDLIQAEVNLINAQVALEDAETKYIWPAEVLAARQKVWVAENEVQENRAMLRGEKLVYDRTTGTYSYQELKTAWDIKVYTQKLSEAEEKLRIYRAELDKLLAESAAGTRVADAMEELKAAQRKLDSLLASTTADTPAEKEQIAIQRLKVDLAQKRLADAQEEQKNVAIKRLQAELTRGKLDDAKRAVEDAQKTLDEAKSKSTVIIAPFSGFVTKVNVQGGQAIQRGTVAVEIADPTKFEADILVGEMDILRVKLGGAATVQADALPGVSLPAKVTQISPTATISQGVVNYKVKVELEALKPAPATTPAASANMSQKDLNQRLDEAVKAGRITAEQAEQMKARLKQMEEAVKAGRITPEQIEQFRARWGEGQRQRQAQATIPPELQLKEGLTVTVTIGVEERRGVLLVPNKAITRQGGETYVQVLKDGVAERRAIKVGISDWQRTEVTSGLSEGEKVVLPQATTPTPTTQQPRQQSPLFLPGVRR